MTPLAGARDVWRKLQLRALIAAALVSGFFPGCQSKQKQAPATGQQEVRALLRQQVEAWNRGDIDGFMAGYWPSDSLVFASGGTVTRGWKTVLDRYKVSYGTPELMGHLDFKLLQIDLIGGRHAKALGRWRVQRADTTLGGVFTLILRRFPDGWRIVHDHTSSGKPAGEGSEEQ